MDKALWIGPRHSARDFRVTAGAAGLDLIEFESVDAALEATAGIPIPVAIVAADWGDASPTIKKLVASAPTLIVVTASRLGVPLQLGLSLNAGATSVLDLQANDQREITRQLGDAVARHRRRMRERELLLRLRALNEEFLKNMVTLEQRNIALEQQILGAAEVKEGPGRVLVVDDEAIVCEVVGSILEQTGLRHTAAESGAAALELLGQQPFDVLITDKNLPDMTGLDLLRETRKLRPDTAVIVITGYASKESAIEALNLGAEAYFEKPFDVKTISDTVHRIINTRRERSQKQHYIGMIKQRNKDFLEQYRSIRQELEAALQQRAMTKPPAAAKAERAP